MCAIYQFTYIIAIGIVIASCCKIEMVGFGSHSLLSIAEAARMEAVKKPRMKTRNHDTIATPAIPRRRYTK